MKWRPTFETPSPNSLSVWGAFRELYNGRQSPYIFQVKASHNAILFWERTHTHTHAKPHTRTQSQECQDNSTISKDPARTGIIVKHKPHGARWRPHGKPQSRWSPKSYSIYCVLSINVRTLDDIWHNRHLCKESWLHSNKIKKNKKITVL